MIYEKLITREAWLESAVTVMSRELFRPAGFDVPKKVRVSVGFPKGAGGKKGGTHTIGQCWYPQASADKHHEIFIHPEIDHPRQVLEILTHEVVHSIAGPAAGHKLGFRVIALKVGLTGPMTATVATPELDDRFKGYLKQLPKYPHASLNAAVGDGPKKQGTRYRKIECPACGYSARTTAKWIEIGLPTCPCGEQMECADLEDEPD